MVSAAVIEKKSEKSDEYCFSINENPFPGERPYSEKDSRYFFGRDRDIRIISDNLVASRFTILYGESGVGKSSLLRAGVVPRLNKIARDNVIKYGSSKIAVVVFPPLPSKDQDSQNYYNPWQDPKDQLLAEVKKAIEKLNPELQLHSPSEKAPLVDTLRGWTDCLAIKGQEKDSDLYVILDQFEDYILLSREVNFDDEFAAAVQDRNLRVNFLIAIRSDWLAKLSRYTGKIYHFLDNRLELNPLEYKLENDQPIQQNKNLIEKPIEKYNKELVRSNPENGGLIGVKIEEGLVDQVLKDVKVEDEFGNSLISTRRLQLAMSTLWDDPLSKSSRMLRKETYENLGNSGEELDKKLEKSIERMANKKLLDRIKQLDLSGFRLYLATVIFQNLVTPSGRDIPYSVDELYEFAKDYKALYQLPFGFSKDDIGALLNDLSQGEFVILSRLPDCRYKLSLDLLGKPIYYWQLDQWSKIKSQMAVFREGKNLDEIESLTRKADESRDSYERVKLALRAYFLCQHHPNYTDQNFLQKYKNRAFSGVDLLLRKILQDLYPPVSRSLNSNQKDVSVAFSLDGRLALGSIPKDGGDAAGKLAVWKPEQLQSNNYSDPCWQNSCQEGEGITSLAFHPHSLQCLVVGSNTGRVILWDLSKPETVPITIGKHNGHEVRSVAFSPDGRWVASASWDRTIHLWDSYQCVESLDKFLSRWQECLSRVTFSKSINLALFLSDLHCILLLANKFISILFSILSISETLGKPEALPDFYEDWFWSVAFSPDGKWLAAGCRNGTIWLWQREGDLWTQKPKLLIIHRQSNWEDWKKDWRGEPKQLEYLRYREVFALAFSPDSETLAAGGRDGMVRLWAMKKVSESLNNGGESYLRPCRTLRGHGDMIRSLAFSPDGQFLASGSDDRTVRVWREIGSPAPSFVSLTGFELGVNSIAFSLDSQTLATGSWDGKVRLWQRQSSDTPSPIVLDDHQDEVRAIAFSPDNPWMASGGFDRKICLWMWKDLWIWKDLGSKARPKELPGKIGEIRTLALSPKTEQGFLLAAGGCDRVVRVWKLGNFEEDPVLWEPFEKRQGEIKRKGEIRSVAFSQDGRWLVSASGDGAIELFDIKSHGCTPPLESCQVPQVAGKCQPELRTAAFSPDGNWIAAGSSNGKVELWRRGESEENFESVGMVGETNEEAIRWVSFSPKKNELLLAVGTEQEKIRFWSLKDLGKPELQSSSFSGSALAFSPDGKLLATGSRTGIILIYDLYQSDIPPFRLEGQHQGEIRVLAFTPDSQWLASGSDDKTVRLWKVTTQRLWGVETKELADKFYQMIRLRLRINPEQWKELVKEKTEEEKDFGKALELDYKEDLKREFYGKSERLISPQGEMLERVKKLLKKQDNGKQYVVEEDVANDLGKDRGDIETYCRLENLCLLDFLDNIERQEKRQSEWGRIHYRLSPKYRQYLELVTPLSALPSPPPPVDAPSPP